MIYWGPPKQQQLNVATQEFCELGMGWSLIMLDKVLSYIAACPIAAAKNTPQQMILPPPAIGVSYIVLPLLHVFTFYSLLSCS